MCQAHKILPTLEGGGVLDINYSKAGFCILVQVLWETCNQSNHQDIQREKLN